MVSDVTADETVAACAAVAASETLRVTAAQTTVSVSVARTIAGDRTH